MFVRVQIQRDFGNQKASFNLQGEEELLGMIMTLCSLLCNSAPETGDMAKVTYIEHTSDEVEKEIEEGK